MAADQAEAQAQAESSFDNGLGLAHPTRPMCRFPSNEKLHLQGIN